MATVGPNRAVVATAGTASNALTLLADQFIVMTAETNNTGLVVYGGTNAVVAALATRKGIPLAPGDPAIIYGPYVLWLDAEVSTDGITYDVGSIPVSRVALRHPYSGE
jgi:hypothetical protein